MEIQSSKAVMPTASFNPLDPIGSILSNAMDDVTRSLAKFADRVHDDTVDILNQAAEKAARLIVSLQTAYEDSLQKTYQAADKLLRENIDRVDELVRDIIQENADALIKVADRIGEIIKFSPLSNWWLPLLSDVTPEFCAVGIDPNDPKATITTVLITFTGNFAYADRPGCIPTFTLNNTKYQPSKNTTKTLQFLVGVSSDDPQIKMHQYSYLKGTLEVTWKSGYMPWSWTVSKYETLLGMLPTCPGKITVVYTKAASEMTDVYKSPDVIVNRNKEHWQTNYFKFSPNAPWHVKANTGSIQWMEKRGDQINAQINTYDYDVVNGQYSNKDGSGKFQVWFTVYQTIPEQVRQEEYNDLRWGSSVVVQPQANEKFTKILFDAFNGDKIEFQPRTDNSNSFITLREYDGTIQIQARKASEINSQDVSLLRKRNVKAITP